MVTYTPGLTWPRTDGDKSTWPTKSEQVPSSTQNWWEQLSASHEKYKLYEEKVGKHVAEKMHVNAAIYRMELPEGYALFAHHKPNSGASGGERVDVYLFGSKHLGKTKFRSPNELLPHTDWLLNLSLPIDDHSNCTCIYNKSSDLARLKKQPSNASPSSSKRPSTTLEKPSKPPKRERPNVSRSASSDQEYDRSAVVPERETDLTSMRRFRKGELVWFRIPTVRPPPPSDLANAGHPDITHWPGLVSNIITTTRVIHEGNTSLSALNAIMGNSPSASKTKTVKTMEYHIRPLGLFHMSSDLKRTTQEMLPWTSGNDLLGGESGWERIGPESTRVIAEGVSKDVDEIKGRGGVLNDKEVEGSWRSRWGKRRGFADYLDSYRNGPDRSKEWDAMVFRLGIALKVAQSIADAFTLTDKIEVPPDSDVNKEDLDAILNHQKTLYQGIWWGGERIWAEDMIRIKKRRSDLPTDSLKAPSDGANDRAVFFRSRMITVELPSTGSGDTSADTIAWQCLLYGDIFELADEGHPEANVDLGPVQSGEVPLVSRYPAPKGYAYRQLNKAEAEITIEIVAIAGRAYPDLLDPTTQNWYTAPSLSVTENRDRVDPGISAQALTGLAPGTQLASLSESWKTDLYTIVNEANRTVEQDMRKFYENLLKKQGIKVVPDTPSKTTPATNGIAQNLTLDSIENGKSNGSLAPLPTSMTGGIGHNGGDLGAVQPMGVKI